MADVYSPEKRSEVMKRVRSKKNKSTELRLIEIFKQYGVTGWRRNYPVKGHPDFVFLDKKIAIFVDGCFWHGHDCRNTKPENNKEYWVKKQMSNITHDKEVTALFQNRGWKVLRIWECELKMSKVNNIEDKLNTIGVSSTKLTNSEDSGNGTTSTD